MPHSHTNALYVADYAIGDIHRSAGCAPSSPFASLAGLGAIAFPPAGSAYDNYVYACTAFLGPISRISSTSVAGTDAMTPGRR